MTPAAAGRRDHLPVTVIEAGAGTGKTYRLAEEISRAVASGEVRPEAILLTTFTRRAAAELTSRVTSRLIGAGRTREALRVGQARIGTVHSVCGRLLEQYALSAGLAVRHNVIPESEQRRLLNEALSTVLKPEENEELQLMAQCLYRLDWRDDVRELIGQARSNALAPEQFAGYAEASVREILAALPPESGSAAECLRLAREVEPQLGALLESGADTHKNTREALSTVRSYLALAEREVPVYWQRFQQLARAAAAKRTGAHALYQPLAEYAAGHHQWPEFRRQLGAYVRAIFALAARACERYEWIKAQAGVIDYADQEALAARLLEQEEVRAALAGELDLVLVDEFQDTSPLQLHLFLLLARCAPRSVWVGDPKQAIFGFRGTDPQLMLGVVERFTGGLAAGPERLDRSWRSLPQLVDWVNAAFQPVFARQGLDPQAVALRAQREGRLPAGSLESWVCRADNQEQDYAAIAAAVAQCLAHPEYYPVHGADGGQRPLRASDLAIAARTNAECAGLAQALAAAGVPYEMSTAGLLRQPVCDLLLAALTLLLDPYDRLAAAQVTWFHDVWSAVTDAARQQRQAGDWLAARVREAETRDGARHPVVAALAAAAAGSALLAPAELARRAADVADVWRLVQGSAAPARAAADVDQFLALVREYEEIAAQRGQGVTHGGLLSWLRALAQSGDDQRHAAASDAVRITTWHGAKGLEWPMVVLYGFGDEPQTRFFGISAFTEGQERGAGDVTDPLRGRALRFVPFPYHEATRNCGYRKAFVDTARFREAAAGDARERARLLYVITTRARDRLVIAARRKARGGLRGLEVDGAPLCEVPQEPAQAPSGWRVREVRPARPARPAPAANDWFEYRARPPLIPARALPSHLQLPAGAKGVSAGAVTRFAPPLELAAGGDPAATGAALHRLLAVDAAALSAEQRLHVAQRVLSPLPAGAVAPEQAVRCKEALEAHVARHWPGAALRREWPVSLQLDGLRLEGLADLVVEQEKSFVLIDYKTFTGNADESALRAHGVRYAPQLAAYRLALERALDKTCAATLICYPLRGELLEVHVAEPEQLLHASSAAAGGP